MLKFVGPLDHSSVRRDGRIRVAIVVAVAIVLAVIPATVQSSTAAPRAVAREPQQSARPAVEMMSMRAIESPRSEGPDPADGDGLANHLARSESTTNNGGDSGSSDGLGFLVVLALAAAAYVIYSAVKND